MWRCVLTWLIVVVAVLLQGSLDELLKSLFSLGRKRSVPIRNTISRQPGLKVSGSTRSAEEQCRTSPNHGLSTANPRQPLCGLPKDAIDNALGEVITGAHWGTPLLGISVLWGEGLGDDLDVGKERVL